MPDLSDHIEGFGWVIVSGEQGCNKVEPRPFDAQWARNIRDLCADRGIPFRFSHVAGRNWHPSRLLDGVLHNEAPSLIPEVGEIKPGGCEVAMCA